MKGLKGLVVIEADGRAARGAEAAEPRRAGEAREQSFRVRSRRSGDERRLELAPPAPRPRPERFAAMSDAALLGAVLGGEAMAWRVFYRRFRGLVLSCAMKTSAAAGRPLDGDELMDVVGDAFANMVKADCRRLRLYREDGGCSVATWIGVIANSTTRDHLRRVRRHPTTSIDEELIGELVDHRPSPEDRLIDHERRAFVDAALAELTPRDRDFVWLYFAEAERPEAIAAEMGVSVATVYSKKAKIKARLARRVADAGG